ncbi:MAG TPA: glycoside hydrolase family 30 beta sandwich domain-containing protein, partial [Chitinophagaceae bacterium]|nr:glycoside hydrolase family 30 beta sandwich domain-containing protein [Chitinophagaceae bacterium]
GSKLKAEWWLTTSNRSSLLQPQATLSTAGTGTGISVILDTSVKYQTVDGFGYTLTGGSAQLISAMEASARAALLQELFGSGANSIKVSYLRISIGASDLNADVFSYDDIPAGQTDVELKSFSLDKDRNGGTGLIPLLKEILAINPSIKILGSPWSAPVWMKDNNNSMGGSLQKKYYDVYARYFVKYIQQMKAEGITVDAITPQNEPLHPGNNPSMYMTAVDQAEFIRDHLGPAFRNANISTKIIVYDHNCNKPEYPIAILNDATAKAFIDGSAFHLYEGDISALSTVRDAHPDKNLYFTEQWTGSKGSFDGDLIWHIKNVVIGSMRNWSRVALEWNLANDADFKPHTPGGCTECKGALTISGNNVNRNVSYYIIAHASRFVPAGSVRVGSSGPGFLPNVAFRTPAGKLIIIIENESDSEANFDLKLASQSVKASLPAKSVATYELIP